MEADMLKTLRQYLFFFFIAALCLKCSSNEETEKGKGAQEAYDELDFLKKQKEQQKKIDKETQSLEEKRRERIKKGDTLAMTEKKLASYLPARVMGYRANGEFSGTPVQMSGQSYASFEREYSKNDSHLKITLVDYNGLIPQNANAIATWKSGLAINNRRTKAGSIYLYKGNMPGWEVYHKRVQRAEITLAVSDRIMLYLIADRQSDTEFLKRLAESLRLNELAKY